METLTIKSAAGSSFLFSPMEKGVIKIDATTPAGKKVVFYTYAKNGPKSGKIKAWDESGSSVDLPLFGGDEKLISFFDQLRGRKKVTFVNYDERNSYPGNIGQTWIENGIITAYEYAENQ